MQFNNSMICNYYCLFRKYYAIEGGAALKGEVRSFQTYRDASGAEQLRHPDFSARWTVYPDPFLHRAATEFASPYRYRHSSTTTNGKPIGSPQGRRSNGNAKLAKAGNIRCSLRRSRCCNRRFQLGRLGDRRLSKGNGGGGGRFCRYFSAGSNPRLTSDG